MDQNSTFRPVGQVAATVVRELTEMRRVRAVDLCLDLLRQADAGPVDPLTLGRAIVAVLESFPEGHPLAVATKIFAGSLRDLRAHPEAVRGLSFQMRLFDIEYED